MLFLKKINEWLSIYNKSLIMLKRSIKTVIKVKKKVQFDVKLGTCR